MEKKSMYHLLVIPVLAAALLSSQALADGRAFPPDGCSGTNPFMAFDGVASGGNTYCINGQNVLSNALPGCSPNQQVVFNGTSFICQDNLLDTPDCGPGQFLTSSGGTLSCASTSVPTCQANYVLTYNGSAFVCVPKNASIPTCDANQFLTYNGSSFQCAATQNLTIPTCGAGEMLTGSGGQLVCAPSTAGSGLAIEHIGDFVDSGTKTLPAGKKFSAYKAILIQAGGFPTSVQASSAKANTTFIPVATWAAPATQIGGYLTGKASAEAFVEVMGWDSGYRAGGEIAYINDTTFNLYHNGSLVPNIRLWGIK
jgi:hypothetical protein